MKKAANTLFSIPKYVGTFLIRTYQLFLRPLFPSACRFYPTCSDYSLQAIQKYGLIKGVYLGIRRISRCHGGNPGGVDELK
jgi:putative membrane protein insertion efficiency factor